MNFLFLYTELADYFIKCCKHLSAHGTVHIVRWPVNKEAPFKFQFSDSIKIYDKNNFTREQLKQLLVSISPDVIICSGWIDKDYLALVKPWYKKIPTVLACDTHWKGSLKQNIAALLSPFFLRDRFSNAWVPGKPQHDYVRKLGFKEEEISTGFYCCDLDKFNELYTKRTNSEKKELPRRFLYVGRYYEFKGLQDLWKAFIELQNDSPNEWELWCLGTGDLHPVVHPKIRHFGFVQPSELEPILEQCSVFILPSRFEPWGVVVQEYAACGFPLLLSKEVGAMEAFLEEGVNGFSFAKENVQEIKNSLKKIISLDNKQLLDMCGKSHKAAQKITPEKWTDSLLKIIDGFHKK
ncbi:MAG: glycosyltransferase family 4 protein [Bacteroidetes bacterium]|nr:glycosyltransferase family 4 protein [Bacteroidota bacterium]